MKRKIKLITSIGIQHFFAMGAFCAAMVIFVFPSVASAASPSWNGNGGDGLWSTASNWSTGAVPGANDYVTIWSNSGAVITIDVPVEVITIALDGGGGPTINQNYPVTTTYATAFPALSIWAGTWNQNARISTNYLEMTAGTFNGNSSGISIPTVTAQYSLKITGGTFNAGAQTIDLDKELYREGGTLNAQGSTIYVGTNLTFYQGSGSFNAATSTIILDGGSQNVVSPTGNITFNNFTKSVTSASTMQLPQTYTLTFTGTLTLTGTSGNLLSIRTSHWGSLQAMIDPQGTRTIDYVSLRGISNTNATSITISDDNNVDVSDNSGFVFSSAPSCGDNTCNGFETYSCCSADCGAAVAATPANLADQMADDTIVTPGSGALGAGTAASSSRALIRSATTVTDTSSNSVLLPAAMTLTCRNISDTEEPCDFTSTAMTNTGGHAADVSSFSLQTGATARCGFDFGISNKRITLTGGTASVTMNCGTNLNGTTLYLYQINAGGTWELQPDIYCTVAGGLCTFTGLTHFSGGEGGDNPAPEFSTWIYLCSILVCGWFVARTTKPLMPTPA